MPSKAAKKMLDAWTFSLNQGQARFQKPAYGKLSERQQYLFNANVPLSNLSVGIVYADEVIVLQYRNH